MYGKFCDAGLILFIKKNFVTSDQN